jgi:AraC family transcriptional regulator
MTQKLPYGCSVAKVLQSQTVAGFILTHTLYTPRLKLPEHAHERACFSFVLQGGFTESSGTKIRSCLPASVIYLPPGEVHSDEFHNSGARCLHIELNPDVVMLLRDRSVLLEHPLVFNGRTMTYLIAKLCHELAAPDSVSSLALEALALELVVELSRATKKTLSHGSRRQCERARDFIDENFTEQITLTRIAEAVGAHPVYLAREFPRRYRCTIGDYVRRLRIEFACRRLSDSNESIASIALSAGFFDQSHFSRTFKRLTGMTPARYRGIFRYG